MRGFHALVLMIVGLVVLVTIGTLALARRAEASPWLIFSAYVDEDVDLYRMLPDGTNVWRLTQISGTAWYESTSPDGSWFIVRVEERGHHTLYRMRPDGSAIRPLVAGDGDMWFQSWTPDGEWLIFWTDGDLYRSRLDGSEVQKLTVDPNNGVFRAWYTPIEKRWHPVWLVVVAVGALGGALGFRSCLKFNTGTV